MKFFINKIVINGAKNIDKTIELNFSNRTITKDFDYSNSNVKAIYGPNGSGKSGIISAMYIYKRIIDDIDGINDKTFARFINETTNKKNGKMNIIIIFSVNDLLDNKKNLCFKHELELTVKNEDSLITKEVISILKGKTIKDENFRELVLIENGKIINLKRKKGAELTKEPLYIYSLNLLDKHSITFALLKLIEDEKKPWDYNDDVVMSLSSIIMLTYNIVVELNKEDIHVDYINNKIIEQKYDCEKKVIRLFESLCNDLSITDYLFTLSTQNRDIVPEKKYAMYEETILKLTDFLRIFKPDLDEIIIDKKINEDKYYCDKIFRYDSKKINVEFESTGIKKLVKLYSTLKSCANGNIAFIDEMDANLHDVYFTKIIEFFKNDGKGQLCFTTHNLEPIDVLKSNNHSLDFLSNDSRIYSWVKDGNKSPMSKYLNGLIPYSPFNVESFDFDLLLDEEK